MAGYLIAFNDDWVPDLTVEQLVEASRATKPMIAEMEAAGALDADVGLQTEVAGFSLQVRELVAVEAVEVRRVVGRVGHAAKDQGLRGGSASASNSGPARPPARRRE